MSFDRQLLVPVYQHWSILYHTMTNKLTIHILHSTNTVDSKRKDCGSQEPSSRHYREGACGGCLKNLYFLLILTFTISKLVLEPVIHAGVGTACWSAWWSGEVYGGSGWRHHQLLPKVIIAYTKCLYLLVVSNCVVYLGTDWVTEELALTSYLNLKETTRIVCVCTCSVLSIPAEISFTVIV